MLKKIILLLLIICIAISGFAQKNKRKSEAKSPKSDYVIMTINGEDIPEERYCPYDSILFGFTPVSSGSIAIDSFYWYDTYTMKNYFTDSIRLAFPSYSEEDKKKQTVFLFLDISIGATKIKDTISTTIYIDYFRTILDTTVCRGRDITVPTLKGDVTFINVQKDETTLPDTLVSASGCDSLVYWHIQMNPYIEEEYSISSCDSIIWGDSILRRPLNFDGDFTDFVERIFLANNPDISCDTLKILNYTIIDTAKLSIGFDQQKFCEGEEMEGTFDLETNFTAFDWTCPDKDTTSFEAKLNIEYPGYYIVLAYMDTSLYDTLKDLRIVNCFLIADILVEDCPVEIPNIITPNGDGLNDYLGIKKLNPDRENELTIHDRWGKLVFKKKNYQCLFKRNEYYNIEGAFEGKSMGGQKLPDGTYYYAFKYDSFPKKKTYTGVIYIVRD